MTQPANDRPPLKTIEQSGNYRLKLIAPKFEKVKVWEDGTTSSRLFFVDVEGNCLSKNYSTKYGKALAMLVGKFSGKFTAEIRNGEWQGKPQFKYKLAFARGTVKPTAAEPQSGDVPF